MPFTKETLEKHAQGSTFIETGTYTGDGVRAALAAGFSVVHSIELDPGLYARAEALFRDDPRVTIHHGDSADALPDILSKIPPGETCTVWLDAHASGPLPGGRSGGTPVLDEIQAIGRSGRRCVIMIDDARLFGSAEWSGVTESQALAEIPSGYRVSREDGHVPGDIIVCTPPHE